MKNNEKNIKYPMNYTKISFPNAFDENEKVKKLVELTDDMAGYFLLGAADKFMNYEGKLGYINENGDFKHYKITEEASGFLISNDLFDEFSDTEFTKNEIENILTVMIEPEFDLLKRYDDGSYGLNYLSFENDVCYILLG